MFLTLTEEGLFLDKKCIIPKERILLIKPELKSINVVLFYNNKIGILSCIHGAIIFDVFIATFMNRIRILLDPETGIGFRLDDEGGRKAGWLSKWDMDFVLKFKSDWTINDKEFGYFKEK